MSTGTVFLSLPIITEYSREALSTTCELVTITPSDLTTNPDPIFCLLPSKFPDSKALGSTGVVATTVTILGDVSSTTLVINSS